MLTELTSSVRASAIAAGVIAAVLSGASVSKAATLTAAYLNIDGSGSISKSDFLLQKNAYTNLLGGVNTDGSIAIGVLQFGRSVSEVFPLKTIDSVATRDNLVAAVDGMTKTGGSTALGPGVQTAAAALTGGFSCKEGDIKCLIDVSTDGYGNVGTDQITAANSAVAAGVDQVNCLGVTSGAKCNFVAGAGAFSVTVDSFADFERALRTKLSTEGVVPPGPNPSPVPLPAGGWLLLAGLGGLAVMKRRTAQT